MLAASSSFLEDPLICQENKKLDEEAHNGLLLGQEEAMNDERASIVL